MKPSNVSRREFIAMAGMATAAVPLGVSSATAASSRRVSGANNKIRMGFIGIGNRGSQVMAQFMKQPEVEIAALCDVYEPYLVRDLTQVDPRFLKDREGQIPKMDEKFTPSVKRFHDFRKLLEQKDIDAVCIATPDRSPSCPSTTCSGWWGAIPRRRTSPAGSAGWVMSSGTASAWPTPARRSIRR